MNETNDVVARYAAAWKAGDLAGVRACYHPDLVLHYAGGNPLSGDHVGLEASLKALAEVGRRANRRLLEIVAVLTGDGDRAALIVREHFVRGDLSAEVERVLTYRIADGRLRECWVYDADQDLIDRFLAD